jgi:hypothetical protein
MRHAFGYFRARRSRHEAERLKVPFLGEIPLHMAIRTSSDAGTPVVDSEPERPCQDLSGNCHRHQTAAHRCRARRLTRLPELPISKGIRLWLNVTGK